MHKDKRHKQRIEMAMPATLLWIGENMAGGRVTITNLSEDGLSFHADHELKPGSTIVIGIPMDTPALALNATVVWCRVTKGEFPVGATFGEMSDDDRRSLRGMIEAIVTYRSEVLQKEHRSLSMEQAVNEWLEKNAQTHFQKEV